MTDAWPTVRIYDADRLEHYYGLLMFVRKLKSVDISMLPPALFSMVNTLAICLRMLEHKDIQKVRAFVNFWMEKIEIEVTDEQEYDYPKYVLRNTLCNILFELEEFLDCIKHCNFTIKEVSSDIRTLSSLSSSLRSKLKDRVKLMILAILYKIDSLLCLKQGSKNTLQETLNKCYTLVDKFDLRQDTALVNSISSKLKMIHNAEYSIKPQLKVDLGSMSYGDLTKRDSLKDKAFIIKNLNKMNDITITTPRGNRGKIICKPEKNFFKKNNTESSPKHISDRRSFTNCSQVRSPKSVAFANKNKSSKDRGLSAVIKDRLIDQGVRDDVKSILRNRSSNKRRVSNRDNRYLDDIKKEFTKEISELLALSSSLKNEIIDLKDKRYLNTQPDHVRQSDRHIVDELFSLDHGNKKKQMKSDNIGMKIQSILDSQIEWENQRKLLSDKLERLEKNMDKQTADETYSNVNMINQSNMQGRHPTVKESNTNNEPHDRRKSFNFGALEAQSRGSSNYRHAVDDQMPTSKAMNVGMSQSSMSDMTSKSRTYQLQYTSFESVIEYCIEQMNKPVTLSTLVDVDAVKHKILYEGKMYNVIYQFKHGDGKDSDECGFSMKLFDEGADFKSVPLVFDQSTGDELKYILKSINVLEVLPSHLSVTSFVHISYIVNFILHKFVQVKLI